MLGLFRFRYTSRMLLFVWMACACALPAHAAKRLLTVVVLPFDAGGALKYDLPDALELELELVETVIVKPNKRVWAELRKQSDKRFDAKTLKRVCKRRSCDILVRGVEGWTPDGEPALHIVAYARNGTARHWSMHDTTDTVDELAREITSALESSFRRWGKLKRVKVRFPDDPGYRDDEPITDDDLFVESASKKSKKKRAPVAVPEDEPLVLDDLFSVDRKQSNRSKKKKRRMARSLEPEEETNLGERTESRSTRDDDAMPAGEDERGFFDDSDNMPISEERERRSRRRDDEDRFDDEDDRYDRGETYRDERRENRSRRKRRERRSRRDDPYDDNAYDRKKRMDLDGDEDGSATSDVKLSHLFSVSGGLDLGSWYYAFDGNRPEQSTGFWIPVFPGARVQGTLWPIEWVGIDVDARAMIVNFETANADAPIYPQQFNAYQIGGGGALNGRYILDLGQLGVGGGGRIGYRYLGLIVEPQKHTGDNLPYTIVPGYHFHALSVGAHLFGAVRFLDRRLEVEVDADLLPATTYSEEPDNPGSGQLAFGWNVEGKVRMDLFKGVFLEGSLYTAGLYNTFTGTGDRLSGEYDADGNRVLVQGGTVLNGAGGAAVSLGYFF